MSVSRNLTNNYIKQKESSIDNQYRLKFHMSPRVGWMNDPNGLVFFNGQYHLYYQAYPYRTKPGQMVWSHMVSPDLISFEDKGVALSLDELGENAYSGGAIVKDNELHIFYTLHTEKHPQFIRYDGDLREGDEIFTEEENEKRKTMPHIVEGKDIKEEDVYHSSSLDGEEFEKGDKVFDNETLPPNYSQNDFRDPCPVKVGEYYYLFLGGKDESANQGIIVVLKGKTLDHFEYAFTIGPFYELGDMGECPSYFKVDNKDVIVVCGSNTVRRDNDFRNINCSVFIVGDLDFEKGEMKVDYIKEIDKGDSFYAPQFIREISRPIIVGWLEMWGKKYPTSKWHHGYVGAFSIPRELFIKDNDIYQRPIKELDEYTHPYEGNGLPRQADISLKMEIGSSLIIKGENGQLKIENGEKGVGLDNTLGNSMFYCVRQTNHSYQNASLRILLDTSSLEIFVEDGKEVISTRFYIDGDLSLIASNGINELTVKEIGDKK